MRKDGLLCPFEMEQLHVVHLEVFPSFGQIAKVKSFFLRLK